MDLNLKDIHADIIILVHSLQREIPGFVVSGRGCYLKFIHFNFVLLRPQFEIYNSCVKLL